MKTMKKLILLLITVGLVSQNIDSKLHKSKGRKKQTPKALDLNNHFGGPQIGSPYGKETSYEEHIERNPEMYIPQTLTAWRNVEKELEFKPYPGWEQKMNPHQIKSGELKNVAPSASKLINPEITGPKMHIQAEVNYPAHVKVPSFYGFKKEFHDVAAFDKEENRIIHDKVVVNKPQYGWEDKTENISRKHNQFINLKNGQSIQDDKQAVNHGIDQIEETKELHAKKRFRRF